MIWLVLLLGSVSAGWLLGHGNVSANFAAAAASAPEHLLTVLLGVTAGLYGRDRIRLRRTYASPSLAYLGKFFLFVSISPATAWMLAPVEWPAEWLRLFAAGAAMAAAVWIGNLPSRL